MLIDQKDIIKARIQKLDKKYETLQEELKSYDEKNKRLEQKRSDKAFFEFCKHEAKYDSNIAKVLINKDTNPKTYANLKRLYLRSIEEEEMMLDLRKELLEEQIDRIDQNEIQFNTRCKLSKALNNLNNSESSFKERICEKEKKN